MIGLRNSTMKLKSIFYLINYQYQYHKLNFIYVEDYDYRTRIGDKRSIDKIAWI